MSDKFEHIYVTKELSPNIIDSGASNFIPSPEHLKLINQYTLEPVNAEQVRALPIKAMNDQIDRDYDKFSENTIDYLTVDNTKTSPLGKPFILSHNKGELASGRIYLAEKEVEDGVNHLKLWVYIPNTEQHQEFIENILFGIYWAVSVGVRLKSAVCSVCGSEWFGFYPFCDNDHILGEWYEGTMCYRQLEVKELFELSSVYLGAQYGAEVARKMVNEKGKSLELIKSAIHDVNSRDEENAIEDKAVVTYKKFPLADEGEAWSFSASDGDAILGENQDWNKYKSVHTWFDSDKSDSKSGYKLPHHKMISGTIKTVWRGVSAAGNAIMGARGGVSIPSDEIGGCKSHLAKHYKEFDKIPPWENEKVVTLVGEGAELEPMDDGSLKICKGVKIWTYDGTKIVRSEVKHVKDEIDRLNKELETKTEEFDALDVKVSELQVSLDETKGLNQAMAEELESVKSELASKAKVVESYIEGLREEVIKWYKLGKSEGKDEDVDATFVTRLLDKCGDDPELLIELKSDFEERAKAVMPPEVRRSSFEDSTGIEDKDADEPDDDTDGVADSIHG